MLFCVLNSVLLIFSKKKIVDPGGRSLAGIAASNPDRGVHVCLLLLLYVVLVETSIVRGSPTESVCVTDRSRATVTLRTSSG
jgi:hypothetical protein